MNSSELNYAHVEMHATILLKIKAGVGLPFSKTL